MAIPCLHQRLFNPRSTLVQYSFNIERALNVGLTIVVRYRVRLCRCACSSVVRPFLFYCQPMRLVGKSLSTTFLLAFWLWGGRKGMQRNPWRQMWYHASDGYAIWGEVLVWLSAARYCDYCWGEKWSLRSWSFCAWRRFQTSVMHSLVDRGKSAFIIQS